MQWSHDGSSAGGYNLRYLRDSFSIEVAYLLILSISNARKFSWHGLLLADFRRIGRIEATNAAGSAGEPVYFIA